MLTMQATWSTKHWGKCNSDPAVCSWKSRLSILEVKRASSCTTHRHNRATAASSVWRADVHDHAIHHRHLVLIPMSSPEGLNIAGLYLVPNVSNIYTRFNDFRKSLSKQWLS
jgi:hypothetical protein